MQEFARLSCITAQFLLLELVNHLGAMMSKRVSSAGAKQERIAIDNELPAMVEASKVFAKPHGGWIRSLREALGMTRSDLASRLGVEISTVSRIEANEVSEVVKLETMRRVAQELDCDFVYALVPRSPLEQRVSNRAFEIALQELAATSHTMQLEDQGVSQAKLEALARARAAQVMESPSFWRE